MPSNQVTPRTDVKRRKDRAVYERDILYKIIDEAFCASVAVSIDGQPHVQPMLHARAGDDLILHGSMKNRLLNHLRGGGEACVNITLMDGLVLGASVPDHTMNYRSVTIYGRTQEVTDVGRKTDLMRRVFSSLVPERWETLPAVDCSYVENATIVLLLPLSESVAKINESAPAPDENAHGAWTGILPLNWTWGPPAPKRVSERAAPETPAYLRNYKRPF